MDLESKALQSLALTEFRSYERLDFAVAGRSVYLYGQNGAGKTNLVEAISVLGPGKGLRGSAFADLGRRLPDELHGRAWGVAAVFGEGEDAVKLSTGADPRDLNKRLIRMDGEPVSAARLLDHARLIWLTPAQDRLFIEARTDRLRFFDRLVFAAEPSHAGVVSIYEKALRERLRLLTDAAVQGRGADDAWLTLLEDKLAEAGTAMVDARQRAIAALQGEIEDHKGPFPKADLSLTGEFDQDDLDTYLKDGFRRARSRDGAAGRSLFGPHRMDVAVIFRDKNRPAAEGSTGEQKALLLNIILAQGARLAKEDASFPAVDLSADGKGGRPPELMRGAMRRLSSKKASPILLLDEVAAHLDPGRRHALFDETHALGLQTFFTGTDQGLFDGLKNRALGVRVDAGHFIDFTE